MYFCFEWEFFISNAECSAICLATMLCIKTLSANDLKPSMINTNSAIGTRLNELLDFFHRETLGADVCTDMLISHLVLYLICTSYRDQHSRTKKTIRS